LTTSHLSAPDLDLTFTLSMFVQYLERKAI